MKKVAVFAALFFAVNGSLSAGNGKDLKKDYTISADRYTVDLVVDQEKGVLHVLINGVVNHEMVISLINVRGQEAFHDNLRNLSDEYSATIDLRNLGKGLYFFKVDSGDEIRLKKITL